MRVLVCMHWPKVCMLSEVSVDNGDSNVVQILSGEIGGSSPSNRPWPRCCSVRVTSTHHSDAAHVDCIRSASTLAGVHHHHHPITSSRCLP